MFLAAQISRSSTAPQEGQAHSLSASVRSLFIYPHSQQVFELGSNVPICINRLLRHSHLYFNILSKAPHPQSAIDWASRWFLSIFATCKFSIHTMSCCLVIASDTLCRKSYRWFDIFSCSLATLRRKTSRLLLPFCLRLKRLCSHFILSKDFRRYLGLSYFCPSEVTIKDLIPKSMPMVLLLSLMGVGIASWLSTSTEAKYLLVGVLLMVTVLMSPLNLRCNTILMGCLNLGKYRPPPSMVTYCGHWKDCLFPFFLNLGNPLPCLKKLRYAISKFNNADCKDWLLTSFSHSQSCFNSFNCICKSYLDKLTLCVRYADTFVSRAKLYMNLTQPKCFSNSTFWPSSGYNLYLYDLNTTQNYNIGLTKASILVKLFLQSKCTITTAEGGGFLC